MTQNDKIATEKKNISKNTSFSLLLVLSCQVVVVLFIDDDSGFEIRDRKKSDTKKRVRVTE